jgi:hypothetical protein
MLRLRHADLSSPKVDDTFPEVILINSHDGTSSYRIMGGLFRLVCMNGLVVPDNLCETVRIPHKGDIRSLVIEGSRKVLENSAHALQAAEDWQKVMLSGEEQRAFATAAHYRRFADDDGTVTTPIEPDQLLTPRRAGDRSPDLWRTFNRIQENAIKGGLSAVDRETGRRSTSREVRSIDGDVKLNKALFLLAEQMAAIKTASAAMAA